MTTPAEQQQRHQATMDLLSSMAAFVDEMMEEREERRELEADYQGRMLKQVVNDDE